MAGLIDLALKSTRPQVTLRTQVTPDVVIDLSSTAQPTPPREPGVASVFVEWLMANVIRPEVEVSLSGGTPQRYHPWGAPERNIAPIVALAVVVAAVSTAGASYYAYQRWGKRK